MPVRITPSSHSANAIKGKFARYARELFDRACPSLSRDKQVPLTILQTSFDKNRLPGAVEASTNGLVYSIIEAYSQSPSSTTRR